MQADKLQWKLAVNYDVQKDKFFLFINGHAFLNLPFKATLAPPGPQNIEKGTVMLNGAEVHEGYAQYNEGTFYEWCNEHSIESVSQASFYELACSSSDTLNAVFEDIGRNIDEEEGLKQLKIWGFSDQNTLAEWPLSQLVS